jgi:hypothetical protein
MRLARLSPAAHRMNPPHGEHDYVAGLASGTVLALGATPRPRAGPLLPRARSTPGAAARAFLRASGLHGPAVATSKRHPRLFRPQPCRGWEPAVVPTRDGLCWQPSLGAGPAPGQRGRPPVAGGGPTTRSGAVGGGVSYERRPPKRGATCCRDVGTWSEAAATRLRTSAQ